MFEMILKLASIWWLMFLVVAFLASLTLPLARSIMNQLRVRQELDRWRALLVSIDSLIGCKIDNLPLLEGRVTKEIPELADAVRLLRQDSIDVFRGLWVPIPESRLPYPESIEAGAQAACQTRPALESALLGLTLSVLAFVLAFFDAGSFMLDPVIRSLSLLPVFTGLLASALLYSQSIRYDNILQHVHRSLMLAFERKVPVYTQAGETAIILSRFTDHDSSMLDSVHQLANRVDRMAAGEITNAVTNSIKTLLSATIGPPLQRSSDALAQLAFQLEKNMTSSLNTLGDRLIALEFQQNESANFLQSQYETVTSTLLQQQEMSFKQLGAVQSLMLEQIRDQQQATLALMTSNQQQTLNSLSEGQQISYRTLSNEQHQSIQKMLSGFQEAMGHMVDLNQTSQNALAGQYQKSWSELQGGLALTISSLVAGQEKLNGDWQSAMANLTTALRDDQENLATTLQTNQVTLLSSMTSRQEELASATLALTKQLSATMQDKLVQLTDSLAAQQTQVVETLVGHQARILETLSGQQATISDALIAQQTSLSESLLSQQANVSDTLLTQQTKVSESLLAQQSQVDSSWKQWSVALADQQTQIASVLVKTQNDMAAANGSLTQTVTSALLGQQTALNEDLRARQDEFAHSLQTQQVELANTMQSRQDELLKAFQVRQEDLVGTLRNSQETLYAASNELQERLHMAFQKQQLAAIAQMQQAQDQTLQKVADYHQASLDSMTDDVAKNLGSYLDKYLEPVSARLIASADVLVAAQAYADKVQDAFELQREQVAIVEAGMKDAINSFVDTRRTMMQDLSELRVSTGVMSQSADKMSAIFSGSESGLSDSISELAGTMTVLKDSLEQITSGAVQNTKYLQEQMEQSHRLNQQQITDLASQITTFSDELATRIEQLTLGFSGITEDLVKSVHSSLNEQNDAFSGNVRNLVTVLAEESRSMSLFAQEINSDIESLSSTLGDSVANFNTEIRSELDKVLERFDQDISDVLKRLSHATNELGDAVDALPQALATVRRI